MLALALLGLCSLLPMQDSIAGSEVPVVAASQPDAVSPPDPAPAPSTPKVAEESMIPTRWLWLPALSGAGCLVCAGPPSCLITSAALFLGFGVALMQVMPCLGAIALLGAQLFTVFVGVVPALAVGPCGALGGVGGGLIGALIGQQSVVDVLVGSIPALVVTGLAAVSAGTALVLWFSQAHPRFDNSDPKTYPPAIALVVSGALGMAVGPLALLGISGYSLWQRGE